METRRHWWNTRHGEHQSCVFDPGAIVYLLRVCGTDLFDRLQLISIEFCARQVLRKKALLFLSIVFFSFGRDLLGFVYFLHFKRNRRLSCVSIPNIPLSVRPSSSSTITIRTPRRDQPLHSSLFDWDWFLSFRLPRPKGCPVLPALPPAKPPCKALH